MDSPYLPPNSPVCDAPRARPRKALLHGLPRLFAWTFLLIAVATLAVVFAIAAEGTTIPACSRDMAACQASVARIRPTINAFLAIAAWLVYFAFLWRARGRVVLHCISLYVLSQALLAGFQWWFGSRIGLAMAGSHLLLAASACAVIRVLRRK